MTNLTSDHEEQIMDWSFGFADTPTPPNTVYLALHTDNPTNVGDQNEVVDAGYERQATDAPNDWNRIDINEIDNASEIRFGPFDSETTVSHFTLWDGPDDTDTPLWQGAFSDTRTVQPGDDFIVRVGNAHFEIN